MPWLGSNQVADQDPTESLSFPTKRYNIIYADPPWSYRDKRAGTKLSGGAESHYTCMSLSEIKDLPVQSIAADNAVLFLWVTFPLLLEGLSCMEAWGFKYKTLGFSWIKLNKNGSPFFGIGAYTKSNCEVCLLGIKGRVGRKLEGATDEVLRVQTNTISSAVIAQREEHSKKPSEIRDRIVELFGDKPRIELFARQQSEGWDCWGNEV